MGRLRRIWNSASIPFADARPTTNMWARLRLRPLAGGAGTSASARLSVSSKPLSLMTHFTLAGAMQSGSSHHYLPMRRSFPTPPGSPEACGYGTNEWITRSPNSYPLLPNGPLRLSVGLRCKFNERLGGHCHRFGLAVPLGYRIASGTNHFDLEAAQIPIGACPPQHLNLR